MCGETVRGTRTSGVSGSLYCMDLADFTDLISCMMRVAWSGSAGKLHLSSSMQPVKDLNYGRMRQNSAGECTTVLN